MEKHEIETDQKRLSRSETQSGVAMSGIGAILFGCPFFMLGVWINFVPYISPEKVRVPFWIIHCAGATFFMAGLFLILQGVRGVIKQKWHKRMTEEFPNSKWKSDYAWKENGFRVNGYRKPFRKFVILIGLLIFLGPFNVLFIDMDNLIAFPTFIIGVFDVVIILLFYKMLYALMQAMKYGISEFRFSSFPYYLGEKLEGRFVQKKVIATAKKIDVSLRCVKELYQNTGSGSNKSTTVVCYQTYQEKVTYIEGQDFNKYDDSLRIQFDLPSIGKSTNLISSPPMYWEVEVRAEVKGVDYDVLFLVPVYTKA